MEKEVWKRKKTGYENPTKFRRYPASIGFFFFLRFLRTILILCRINDVFEQQFKYTNRQTQKEESSLELHPPKEVGLRLHSIIGKTKSVRKPPYSMKTKNAFLKNNRVT